jgi:hypothetical protein
MNKWQTKESYQRWFGWDIYREWIDKVKNLILTFDKN